MVNPNGAETTYWFEYGPRQGKLTSTSPQTLPPAATETAVDTQLTGLTPHTDYSFRVMAQNGAGISEGQILEFRAGEQPLKSSSPPASSTDSVVSQTGVSTAASASPSLSQIRNRNTNTESTVVTQTAFLEVLPGQKMPLVLNLAGTPVSTPLIITCANLPEGVTCTYDGKNQTVTIIPAASTPPGSYSVRVMFTTGPGMD
jgi:hypothetical protein